MGERLMKVLIIGGLGYIGSVLYEELKRKGWTVQIMDNNFYRLDPPNHYVYGDIRSKEQIEPIIKEYDVIVLLAAIVGNPACLLDTKTAIEINCFGAKNVAEICNEYNKKLILTSTCSIYGSANKICTEEDETFPVDFYGMTKYTQERIVRTICKDSLIFRLGTAFGLSPRMRYDLVVNLFIAKAIVDEKIEVFGGEQLRPFIHIRDVACSIVRGILWNLRGVYNLAFNNHTIGYLSAIIGRYTGCKIIEKKGCNDIRSYGADDGLFRDQLLTSWDPYEWNITETIKEITHGSPVQFYNYDKYSNVKLMRKKLR